MFMNLEPEADKPYGTCKTCGADIADYEAMQKHFSETLGGPERGSHTIQVVNPTRQERIEQNIDRIVNDSVMEALDKIDREVGEDRSITLEEATTALRHHDTFLEMWDEEYVPEIQDERESTP